MIARRTLHSLQDLNPQQSLRTEGLQHHEARRKQPWDRSISRRRRSLRSPLRPRPCHQTPDRLKSIHYRNLSHYSCQITDRDQSGECPKDPNHSPGHCPLMEWIYIRRVLPRDLCSPAHDPRNKIWRKLYLGRLSKMSMNCGPSLHPRHQNDIIDGHRVDSSTRIWTIFAITKRRRQRAHQRWAAERAAPTAYR